MQPDTPNLTPTPSPAPTQPSGIPPAPVTQQPTPSLQPPKRFGGKKAKLAGIIIAGVILLSAVGAGAYYGIYLPNTPQNVLKKSVANTLKQEKISGKGSASFTGKDSAAVTANYTLQTDSTKNAIAATVDLAISGIKLPLEVRSVDKAFYLKVGDLSTVQALAATALGPEVAGYVDEVSKQISNKWIEFDESLVKTVGGDKCSVLTENSKLSDEDIDKLVSIYDKNEFVEIKKASGDTVDGRKVTKAELAINKDKTKTFAQDVQQLDMFKKLKECSGDAESAVDTKQAEEFKGNYELTAWMDKSKKELVKVSLKITEDGNSVSADFTFNNDEVNITKPDDAVPAMQFLSQFAPLLGAGGLLPTDQ